MPWGRERGTQLGGSTVRTVFGPDKVSMPRWARIAVVTYLSLTAAIVGAVLFTTALALEVDSRFQEGLTHAVVLLTLPVSVAYLVLGLFDSAGPSSGWFRVGGLGLMEFAFYLGFLLLAVVNAAVFRWVVLIGWRGIRVSAAPVNGSSPDGPGLRTHGVNRSVRNLFWTVPLAFVLSLPQWLVAGFAWCGISGCSGGGFGVATGTEWLAISLSIVNGIILAMAVFLVPWLYPTGKRAFVAVIAGTLFGLVGAAVTHG